MVSCLLALALFQPARTYDAELGKFYLVGPIGRVIGSGEVVHTDFQRQIAVRGVRLSLFFGGYDFNHLAEAGRMFLQIDATIKNPNTSVMSVTSADSYDLRIFDRPFERGDVKFIGSFLPDGGLLDAKLKKGESVDLVSVYQVPQDIPHFRFAPFYRQWDERQSPRFDMTKHFPKPTSVFATGKLGFTDTAQVKVGEKFDFEELELKVIRCQPTDDEGLGVLIEYTTTVQKPVPWGWQYAVAELVDENGQILKAYPEFYPAPGYQDWGLYIRREREVQAEYRFYSKTFGKPKEFRLTKNETKRSVTVTGL